MKMNLDEMQKAAGEASTLMAALSHSTRLMILCLLVDGEKSVGALAQALELRQANVSQQLSLLRKDGLVETRREGQTIYYSLQGSQARQVIELLYGLYCS